MMNSIPNVLIVGDSISHGYFPILNATLNGNATHKPFASFQHAPSNTGALQAGIDCFNITTLLGATGKETKWDLIVFNFGHVACSM
jgi:hypothetical protein